MPKTLSFVSRFARVGAVGGATLALVASTQSGERANGDGTCPAGETCSPLTPNGLLFEGSPPGYWPDLTSQAVAAGGYETLRITDNATDAPLALAFTPKMSATSFSTTASGSSSVTVSATGEGDSYLRILSPEGELYDRLLIHSYEVTDVALRPTYAATYPAIEPTAWAVFAGGRTGISVELLASGRTVVDEGMTIRGANASRVAWDTVTIGPAAAGPFELAIDAGHLSDVRKSFSVVDRFDSIHTTGDRSVGVGGDETVCFTAVIEPPQGGTTQVVGVPWQVTFTGPAQLAAEQQYASCMILTPTASGDIVVTANGGGHTATVTLHAQGSARVRTPGWVWLGSEGERAATATDAVE